jgi:hypothetical protein
MICLMPTFLLFCTAVLSLFCSVCLFLQTNTTRFESMLLLRGIACMQHGYTPPLPTKRSILKKSGAAGTIFSNRIRESGQQFVYVEGISSPFPQVPLLFSTDLRPIGSRP